jgi:magnesium transporter
MIIHRSWHHLVSATRSLNAGLPCISHATSRLNTATHDIHYLQRLLLSTTSTTKDESSKGDTQQPSPSSPSRGQSGSLTRKSIHEFSPTFRVAKVSYSGEIETLNMKIPQLLKSASILPRDLFMLNITSRQESRHVRSHPAHRTLSAIVPRDSVIILSFGNVRAVAGLNHVFLLDAHNPSVRDFAEELAAMYRSEDHHEEPPELVFLEHALRDSVESFHRRSRLYEPIVDSFLDKVANEVYSDTGVHQLVPLKDSLQSYEMQVKQSLECLTGLLNNDSEMLALLLTEKADASKRGGKVEFARHEHVELLLGVYARHLSTLAMEIHYSLGRLRSKQEFVALALAGYRNRMIRMNLHIGIAGLSIAVGTTTAAFFGMNLLSGMETSPVAFYYAIFGSGVGGLVVATTSLNYLSGSAMKKRASQRLEEIETLTNALSDLCAVDYTLKTTVERGLAIDKEKFRKSLLKAGVSKRVKKEEIDLLFDLFDTTKDGYIASDDFYPQVDPKKPPPDLGPV